jgi:cobalt-zinc-cadmium efflux system outer membrane protein
VVVAALTLEETRGRLVGAERRFATNPDLDGAIGRRDGEDGVQTDLQVGISQMLQPGSRRRARIDAARAALDQTRADIEDARRRSIGAAVEAFYRAVYAGDRLGLLRRNTTLAAEVLAVTERRYAAGDVAGLDVNLARSSLARTRAEVAGAEADAVIARGELQRLLGLPSPIAVDGSLAGAVADAVTLDSRLTALATRPDLQALEAGVREARAEANVGRSFARPDYGVGARFSREEGDRIVMGTFSISLPLVVKGQDTIVTGLGREARLAATLDATRLQARIEVTATHAAYEQRHAALRLLEQDVVASLDDTLRLATRSFDVGQIGIADLLVMRREVNEARLQYLDTLLSTVLARVALDSASGVLR